MLVGGLNVPACNFFEGWSRLLRALDSCRASATPDRCCNMASPNLPGRSDISQPWPCSTHQCTCAIPHAARHRHKARAAESAQRPLQLSWTSQPMQKSSASSPTTWDSYLGQVYMSASLVARQSPCRRHVPLQLSTWQVLSFSTTILK